MSPALNGVSFYTVSITNAQVNRSISFQRSELEWKTARIEENGEEFQKPEMKYLIITGEAGMPELPVRFVKLIIPSGMDVSDISISASGKENIQLLKKVYPAQYPIPTSVNHEHRIAKPDSGIYNNNNPYPSELVKVVDQGYFDGNHIVTLAVYPVQYLPKSGIAIFHSNINFSLNFAPGTGNPRKVVGRSKKNQDMYNNLLKGLVDNTEDIMRYQVKPQTTETNAKIINSAETSLSIQSITDPCPYEYVIITTNDLKPGFDEFVKWKCRKGITTGVITIDQILSAYSGDQVSGLYDDAGKLRQYLSNAYGFGKTVYALIAGNKNFMPFRYGSGDFDVLRDPNNYNEDYHIPSDLYFSDFDGDWNHDKDASLGEPLNNDYVEFYPEIFVGRMLCQNVDEVVSWTKKVIEYEQHPFNGNYIPLTKSLWSQSDQMQRIGEASKVASLFNTAFSHTYMEEKDYYGQFTTISYKDLHPSSPTGQEVINELNTGYGFYNIYNHGELKDFVVKWPGEHNDNPDESFCSAIYWKPTGEQHGYNISNEGYLSNIASQNKSTIVYSVACDVAGYDLVENTSRCLADGYTILNESGGPAFIGNTRSGFIDVSYILHQKFIGELFNNDNHIGIAVALSRPDLIGTLGAFYLNLSTNLFGDPEMPVWTVTPSTFSSLTVADNGSSITVNTGTSDALICVSSTNNGDTYFVRGLGSQTFYTSVRPLYVTVTKQNYIPYVAITGGTLTSNETWSGQLTVLGNITVNPGVSLTIKPDANLTFKNNSLLISNGSLSIAGTAGHMVNFDFVTPNSNIPNGIKLGSLTMSNISYANIKNAWYGIYVEEAYANISHCTITNCSTGIFMGYTNYTNIESLVQDCTLNNNSSAGIYLTYSSPTILRNKMMNNTSEGIWMTDHSSPQFGYYGVYGENTFSGNLREGILAMRYCNPFLGQDPCIANGGHNIIENNTNWNIYASLSSQVMAENNWWELIPGTNNIKTSKIYADASSSVVYYPPCDYRPSIYYGIAKISPEEKVFDTQFSIQNIGSASLTAVNENSVKFNPNWSLKRQLIYSRALLGMKDFTGAKTLCTDIISKYPDSTISTIALEILWQTERRLNDVESFKMLLKGLREKTEKKPLYGVAGVILAGYSKTDRVKILDELFKEYPDGDVANSILFSKFLYYFDELNDKDGAKKVLNEIDKLFPGSETSIDGHRRLGDSVVEPSVSKETANDMAFISEKPESYSLSGNYPNPFNPSTMIRYGLPSSSKVELRVYDILGKEVMTLVNGIQEAGRYHTPFNASGLPSGIYIYSFKALSLENGKSFEKNSKMLYLK